MSENKKKIYKPQPISGFPEWLPEVRRVEQQWFDHIRRVFESYGFCNIETPSVETLDAINAKGGDGGADVDKEVYVLERLHRDDGDREARLALHFDQTVPLARYTAQHFNDLTFPFKRYQMQRVWRGERPQAGRFREFYQCDIDVINVDNLPLHFDAEMPAIIYEILSSLPGMENEKFQIRVNNRKLITGFLYAMCRDKEKIPDLIRLIDKKEKISEQQLQKELIERFDFNEALLNVFFAFFKDPKFTLSQLKETLGSNEEYFEDMAKGGQLIEIGKKELYFVLEKLLHLPEGSVIADLSVVRGLDYYTGTVYETVFLDDPSYGSICSGGRYDDLASNYINKHLPGVGISIGFSRLFDRLRTQGKLPVAGCSPADIMVVMPSEDMRAETLKTAQILRKRGLKVETYHSPQKVKKQLAYAEKKGIPYVWFPPFESGQEHEIKNMNTGEQTKTTPESWIKT